MNVGTIVWLTGLPSSGKSTLAQAVARALRESNHTAVVVLDGRIVGRGQNRVTSALDPTAHAEVVAIRTACAS